MTEQYRVGIIGAGNMGSAIISSIQQSSNYSIIASRRSKQALEEIKSKYGINVTTDNKRVVAESDIVVLSVKPIYIEEVLEETKEFHNGQLWISVAAGKNIKSIEKVVDRNSRIIRFMANVGIRYGTGFNGYVMNEYCTEKDSTIYENLFQAGGSIFKTLEDKMPILTASASQTGNIGSMINTIIKSLIKGGASETEARLMTISNLMTNGVYLENGGENLLEDVISKKGTTEAAENEAIARGLHEILYSMTTLSADRCEELEK